MVDAYRRPASPCDQLRWRWSNQQVVRFDDTKAFSRRGAFVTKFIGVGSPRAHNLKNQTDNRTGEAAGPVRFLNYVIFSPMVCKKVGVYVLLILVIIS